MAGTYEPLRAELDEETRRRVSDMFPGIDPDFVAEKAQEFKFDQDQLIEYIVERVGRDEGYPKRSRPAKRAHEDDPVDDIEKARKRFEGHAHSQLKGTLAYVNTM